MKEDQKDQKSINQSQKHSSDVSSESPRPAPRVERWGTTTPKHDPFESVESACEEVARLIGWLGYVAENEYTDKERDKLIAAAKKFAEVAQPIANRYLD